MRQILAIYYRKTAFDLKTMKSYTTARYEVDSAGNVSVKEYERGSKKACSSSKYVIDAELVKKYFDEILYILDNADPLHHSIYDDCGGTLTVYYGPDHKEVADRTLMAEGHGFLGDVVESLICEACRS